MIFVFNLVLILLSFVGEWAIALYELCLFSLSLRSTYPLLPLQSLYATHVKLIS